MSGARWVWIALAAYVLGFAITPPRALLIVDEDRYVSQALAFSRGELALDDRGVVYPPVAERTISNYPPATSLLQAPLVRIGGWRAASVLSVLALVVATLATMRWLRATAAPGREAFALLVPAFIGCAFFGRVGMSDMPATALVALTGLLLAAPSISPSRASLAGFTAGSILLFREPVILLVLPLLVGPLARRECSRWAIAGFAGAVALKLGLSAVLFGSPWYLRDPGIVFSIASLRHTVPLYTLILLVLLPFGALLPFAYRGARRLDLTLAISTYVALFLLYDYDSVAMNGQAKGIILASRFMAPAMPLFAILAADVWPRWRHRFSPWLSSRLATAGAGLATCAIALGIHYVARAQETEALHVRDALLRHTHASAPVVTNTDATLKYFSPAYAARRLIVRDALPVDSLAAFGRSGALSFAFLDRDDSPAFREDARENARFLADAAAACTIRPTFDGPVGEMRVHTYEVSGCR